MTRKPLRCRLGSHKRGAFLRRCILFAGASWFLCARCGEEHCFSDLTRGGSA